MRPTIYLDRNARLCLAYASASAGDRGVPPDGAPWPDRPAPARSGGDLPAEVLTCPAGAPAVPWPCC